VEAKRSLLRPALSLVARSALGTVLGLGGTLVLTRWVGPDAYGAYAGAAAITTFLAVVVQCGAAAWLVREPDGDADDAVATALVCAGMLTAVVLVLGRQALPQGELWATLPRLAVTLPVALLGIVCVARLERSLAFTRLAAIELVAQATFYGVALPAAARGGGVDALVHGFWAWQGVSLLALLVAARWRPRWAWRRDVIARILRFGSLFTVSSWLWQARQLVNPLVVGWFGGEAAVGVVALASRLVEAATFAKSAFYRLALAALPRLPERERRAGLLGAATVLQVTVVGACLGAACLLLPLLPLVLGPRWEALTNVVPWIGIALLVNALFNLLCADLVLADRFGVLIRFHAVHVALLAAASALLVPRLGAAGYAAAEMIAACAHALLLGPARRRVHPGRFARAAVIAGAFACLLLQPVIGWIAMIPVVVTVLAPGVRRDAAAAIATVREARL